METFGLWTDDNDSGVSYDNVKVDSIVKTVIEEENDFDLSDIISKVNEANIIDIENNQVTKLNIEMDDVIDLVDEDEEKELIIKGDMEDMIDLDSTDWSNGGTEELDGVSYNVFTGTGANSTIKLLIEDDIDVTPDI